MSSNRREYHVDHCSKKVALFFVACDANPDMRVKIPNAMRIKGFSPSEAADRSLQMQVRHEAEIIKGVAIPGPPADSGKRRPRGGRRIRRVGWSITRGERLHSPSLNAPKTSSKTMSGG